MEAKENEFYKGNRYTYDLALARNMRRTMKSLRGEEHSPSEKSLESKRQMTSDDVHAALRGLEEAELRRDAGDIVEALRAYRISLELLLRYLKDEENRQNIPDIDPSVIEGRLLAAMADAEELKAIHSQSAHVVGTQASSSKGAGGLVSAISSALLGQSKNPSPRAKAQKTKPTSPTALTPGATKKNLKTQTLTLRPARGETGFATSKAVTKIAPPTPTPLSQTPTEPHAELARIAHHQAVLDDLYVPPESVQNTSWDDIAGLQDVKQSLQESAILPLIRPDLFTGLRRPQNILLYGPPGTGKTMLVRAVAKESGSSLFACSASSLTSKWMGEGEKLVKALFQVAQQMSPSLVFLDEVDALLSSRKSDGEHEASRRLKTEFMVQIEGITSHENHVLVLACTNCPWDVDSAVLRRFPRRIFVPLPDPKARTALLEHLLKKAGKHVIKNAQCKDLVRRLEGFSCSDITAIASEASFGPIRSLGGLAAVRGAKAKDMRPISKEDFEEAIQKATKSVTETQLCRFETWRREQSAS